MPLGIGLIASHLRQKIPGVEVSLFKYPSDLNLALQEVQPHIVGFSNYSWNLEISYAFARRIKEESPETVVIFGGPNYGLEVEEMAEFWRERTAIDFYIVREGEIAFARIVELLERNNLSITRVKERSAELLNCHYPADGGIFCSEMAPRIESLDVIPSPYLAGMMDKFFDGVLIPLIHTTRGCPFTCRFCTEGAKYYQKVTHVSSLEGELRYIAERIGDVGDLCLSDANFGMFMQDEAKAAAIAAIKAEFGWPNRLIVSTGKNQKERVIRVAKVLDGSLSVAASLQSTDEDILAEINRSNISIDALTDMVEGAADADAMTYTELILNLPGDSIDRHRKSLRDVIDAGLGIIRMYQFILLPQTELGTPYARKQYGYESRYRINPRSLGRYQILGDTVVVAESEEIVIGTETMPVDDYLSCRQLNLSVEIFHNSGLFRDLEAVIRGLGLSWFDVIEEAHALVTPHQSPGLHRIYSTFREENLQTLYESRADLQSDVELNINRFMSDIEGTNEMSKAKALAVIHESDTLHELIYDSARKHVGSAGSMDEALARSLALLEQVSRQVKREFWIPRGRIVVEAPLDLRALEASSYRLDLREALLREPKIWEFAHSQQQEQRILGLRHQYGLDSVDGVGRTLMRVDPRKLIPTLVS